MLSGGKKIIDIASYSKVNESSIRTIGLNSEKVKKKGGGVNLKLTNKSTPQLVKNSYKTIVAKS